MKSDFQTRAEGAVARFTEQSRKPIVIEFAGTPKAGKTTTLANVQAFLKRCGFRTEVVIERASVCPIRDKKHANFNIWTACTTLSQLLEKTQDPPRMEDPHILILDRGIFDSICWITMMEHLARLRSVDRELIERFLRIEDWRKRISAVIVMVASSADAMQRERGLLPVEDKGGSIMNSDVLEQARDTNLRCADRLKRDFRIYVIDTSSTELRGKPKETAEKVLDIVLSLIEEHVKEEVLVLPKDLVKGCFGSLNYLADEKAEDLAKQFVQSGEFRSREEVESNSGFVQALPIVIVRNASGAILRLRRREKAQNHYLHEKIVIWAGGHVRKEDATNGNALIQCAMRELKEELRLNIDSSELHPAAAMYFDVGNGTSRHVAIVYEWRAKTNQVAIALSNAEFFERRGTSLSGSFIDIANLEQEVAAKKIEEPWSVELIRQHFLSPAKTPKKDLFS